MELSLFFHFLALNIEIAVHKSNYCRIVYPFFVILETSWCEKCGEECSRC